MADLFDDSPDILTTEEVANVLRVSTSTVVRWATDEGLSCIQVGPRLHRFPKWSVKEFLGTAAKNSHQQ
jgi:excisionase family DNA binding protein